MTRVLFIGGAGRSGTTLVERVLARLDGVTAMGEVMHLWQRGVAENQLCGCRLPFHECEVWTRAGREAYGGWDGVDPERMNYLKHRVDRALRIPELVASPSSRFRSQTTEYATTFGRIYRAVSEVTNAEIVIDSSKQVSLPFALRRDSSLDVVVLQIIRDPRGVAHSWSTRVPRPEITGGTVLMPRYTATQSAASWAIHNAGFGALGLAGIRRLIVRYEDVMSDPAGTVERIAGRLGVVPTAQLRSELNAGYVDLDVDHTAAGNPMRFAVGPTRLHPDTKWHTRMADTDARAVRRITWPLLLRYGYPWRTP